MAFLAYEIKHLEHRGKARRQLFLDQDVQWNFIIFDVPFIIGRMDIPMFWEDKSAFSFLYKDLWNILVDASATVSCRF